MKGKKREDIHNGTERAQNTGPVLLLNAGQGSKASNLPAPISVLVDHSVPGNSVGCHIAHDSSVRFVVTAGRAAVLVRLRSLFVGVRKERVAAADIHKMRCVCA